MAKKPKKDLVFIDNDEKTRFIALMEYNLSRFSNPGEMLQAVEDTEQRCYELLLLERDESIAKTKLDTYIAALKTRIAYEEPPPGAQGGGMNPKKV